MHTNEKEVTGHQENEETKLAMAETDLEEENTSETAKNVILKKATEKIEEGDTLNSSNANSDKEFALELYRESLELLMTVIKGETNASKSAKLKETIENLLEKTENIRKELNLPLPSPQLSVVDSTAEQDQNHFEEKKHEGEEEFVEFEVGINLENVECYSILDHHKQLIAEGTLQILKMKEREKKEEFDLTDSSSGQRVSLLKIGAFEFPLTKSIPCLSTCRGNYILPMSGSSFYGFILPADIPDPYIQAFESLLSQMCNLQLQKDHPNLSQENDSQVDQLANDSKSTQLISTESSATSGVVISGLETTASLIGTGAEYAVWGIQWGAKLITSGIGMGGQYLISNTKHNDAPSKPLPAVAATINAATYVSPYAVKVSRGLVAGMAMAAEQFGGLVGNQILHRGKGEGSSIFNGPKTEAAKHVGQTALLAVTNIWEALEEAGKELVVSTSTTTAQIVDHKLGPEHAKLTEQSFSVALDSLQTAYNIKNLGLKNLAKRVAAETGKGAVLSYRDHLALQNSQTDVEMKTIKDS